MTKHLLALLLISGAGPVAAQSLIKAPDFTVEKFDIGGTGAAGYLTAEPSTGRIFVGRETHVMVVEGRTGTMLGDIPNTPGVRGIALAFRSARGFTANAGDSTVSVFDLNTLAVLTKIKITAGAPNGIMYHYAADRIVITVRGRSQGTAIVIRPSDASIVGSVALADATPAAVIADDQNRVYIASESKNSIQVLDLKTLKAMRSLPTAPCVGPSGLGVDLRTSRLFVGCDKKSVAMDYISGKVVASWDNGDGVDGLAWDANDHLMYVPSGTAGAVTVLRMVSPNSYSVIATVKTVPGAGTIAHDPSSRTVYQFQLEGAKSWLIRISR